MTINIQLERYIWKIQSNKKYAMTAMWQAFSKKQNQKSDIKAILNKSYLKSKIQTITIIIKDLEVMSISGKSFLKSAICVTV